MSKPIVLHLGDDIRWNHDLYRTLEETFTIERSHSMSRDDFIGALKSNRFGDIFAIYRPFWNTGGEMGNWDDELISLLPKSCKIFASAGAGFDWVDTKCLAERGVIYCNSAPACTESVADCAIWLLLSCFRQFTWSSLAARSCDPAQFTDVTRNVAAVTHNPSGHSLGIIGLGKIGYRLAQKAKTAFNMKILYHDIRRADSARETELTATFFDTLDGLLAQADAVVVATPFAGTTLIGTREFQLMKPGSFFINIARGKLVNEEALITALESSHLGAAGLDVHFFEPVVNPKLAAMKNVELLCHMAGASIESHVGFEAMGMENILEFYRTGKALSPVNLEWLVSGH